MKSTILLQFAICLTAREANVRGILTPWANACCEFLNWPKPLMIICLHNFLFFHLRKHVTNSGFMRHDRFQTPHLYLGVWNPWWSMKPSFLTYYIRTYACQYSFQRVPYLATDDQQTNQLINPLENTWHNFIAYSGQSVGIPIITRPDQHKLHVSTPYKFLIKWICV